MNKSLLFCFLSFVTASGVCATQDNGQAEPLVLEISPATRYLFIAVLKQDWQGVKYFLRDADVNYVLTKDDAFILNHIAPRYVSSDEYEKFFKEGQTIAEVAAKTEILPAFSPSDVLKALLLSGKMNAKQINYLEDYFARKTMGTEWKERFASLIQEARAKLQQ